MNDKEQLRKLIRSYIDMIEADIKFHNNPRARTQNQLSILDDSYHSTYRKSSDLTKITFDTQIKNWLKH